MKQKELQSNIQQMLSLYMKVHSMQCYIILITQPQDEPSLLSRVLRVENLAAYI